VKKMLALEWVLGMSMLAEPNDHDYELVDEIQEGIDFGHDDGRPLIHGLVMLPRKIRVVSPPRAVGLREWSICLLSIIIESVHLFHRALKKIC
jgi:hypothetical protein